MKARWVMAIVLLALTGMTFAQGADERGKKADQILAKVRQIDLLNQILPVLMTKEQLNKILPVIEKARQAVRDQQRREYDQLVKLEPDLDKAIKEGNEKGLLPGTEIIKRTFAVFKAFAITRKSVADENTANVIAIVKETLNAGQLRSMQNALSPQSFDPSLDPAKMTEDQKLKFFVESILLDPMAYDVMIKIATAR